MPTPPSLEVAESILEELATALLPTYGFLLDTDAPPTPAFQDDGGPDYEARYKALIQHIPGVIFVAPLAKGTGNAYISPQIETILGFTQEEWLHDPLRWYQQVHDEDKLRWSTEASSLFMSGQPLSATYRVKARDGRVVWFQCDARMVRSSNGQALFIHGIGFDVTELKETEESLRKARHELERRVEERTEALARSNAQLLDEIAERKQTELALIAAKEAAEASVRVKSEFMANMSHEIRTPMNGVLGLTNLVLNSELSAEQRKYLSLAYSSAESLLSIINEVLDFSKLESGRTEIQLGEFPLRSNIESMTSGLRIAAEQKGLQFGFEIAPDTPDSLVGDIGRLRQVLTNLIGNAVKFTQQGEIRLTILPEHFYQQHLVARCSLKFSIKDTGIGMPESALDLIFSPFVQADGSITRKYGGTGLGLAISKELVALMGGQIGVTSELGIGSTFFFTIDVEIGKPSPTPSSNIPASKDDVVAGGYLRVLIAEDNPVNQLVVRGVLERGGHSVTIAMNGQEALDKLAQTEFDIILMDIQMPILDGLSATRAIRLMEGRQLNARIPIIGLSAHALEGDRTRCTEAGMDGYVSKPFKASDLLREMQRLTEANQY